MRMDPKHQFAAQYVLTRAANERREREALLAAGLMNMSHFAMTAGAGLPGIKTKPILESLNSFYSCCFRTKEIKLVFRCLVNLQVLFNIFETTG